MVTAEQLKDLVKRLEALREYLELDKKAIEIQNEEEKTQAPEFWNKPKEAEVTLKLIKNKKAWIEEYESVKSALEDVNVLRDFFELEEVDLMARFLTFKTISVTSSLTPLIEENSCKTPSI